MSQGSGDTLVYVGAYTEVLPHVRGTAEGVSVYRLDAATGAFHHLATVGGVVNPSFVAVDRARRRLFAVQEVGEYAGRPGGAVSAFAIGGGGHELALLGHQPTHGAHPCHVTVDASGRWLLVANYSGGSVTVLPVGEDGAPGPAPAVVGHSGPHPHHDGPHPHSTLQAPGGHVLAPDCGLDRVYIYTLDAATGALAPHAQPWAQEAPGSGPRHLALHPRGDVVYCINERDSTLTTFAHDAAAGTLRALQNISTLPAGFGGRNSTADVHVHPSGRFVYGSNRGHDSIAAFAVGADGTLTVLGHTPTGGRTPRNFMIDPSGTFLLAANQDSNTVVTFRIDQATGALGEPLHVAEVPTPVCLCPVVW